MSEPLDPGRLTLLPPAETPPEMLALISAAAQLVWPQPALAEEPGQVHQSWRFSGRWWHKPSALRRDRPWARR